VLLSPVLLLVVVLAVLLNLLCTVDDCCQFEASLNWCTTLLGDRQVLSRPCCHTATAVCAPAGPQVSKLGRGVELATG
jgi:hypothetical protein